MRRAGNITYHEYKTKIKCNICGDWKREMLKIYHTYYSQHPRGENRHRTHHRSMTICTSCRDNLVRTITIDKLMGRGA